MNTKRRTLAKWLKIIRFHGKDYGIYGCAYCDKYHFKDCYGCPVYIATKEIGCSGSPYVTWLLTCVDSQAQTTHNRVFSQESLDAAKAEYNFLKNLPED